METTLTYQYRIKDRSIREVLIPMASEVNFVWNFCNNIIRKLWKESRFYTKESLLGELTKGASKLLDINSQTIQATYQELLFQVKQHGFIRFRSSKWKRKWIPFKGQTIKFCGNYLTYNRHKIRFWAHRPLPKGSVVKSGSLCENVEGKWFLNLVITFPEYLEPASQEDVGIDLGIKTNLATSDGELLERPNYSKAHAEKLAKAQKFHKKNRVKKIHTKIKNQRKDWNHQKSFELASNYRNIFVGDVNTTEILTSIRNINKAVYDASLFEIKRLLSYKVLRRQGVYLEVSEKENASTKTCSCCLQETGPSGIESLGIRVWFCEICGSLHLRDVNSAKNHLRLGREALRLMKLS